MIISAAYYFKAAYVGQILAWVPIRSIYDNPLMQHKGSMTRIYYFTYREDGSIGSLRREGGGRSSCRRMTLCGFLLTRTMISSGLPCGDILES